MMLLAECKECDACLPQAYISCCAYSTVELNTVLEGPPRVVFLAQLVNARAQLIRYR